MNTFLFLTVASLALVSTSQAHDPPTTTQGADTAESFIIRYYEKYLPCLCTALKNDKEAATAYCPSNSSESSSGSSCSSSCSCSNEDGSDSSTDSSSSGSCSCSSEDSDGSSTNSSSSSGSSSGSSCSSGSDSSCSSSSDSSCSSTGSSEQNSNVTTRISERMIDHNNILERLSIQERVNPEDCQNLTNPDGQNPDENFCFADKDKLTIWAECMGMTIGSMIAPNETAAYIAEIKNDLQEEADCYKQNGGTEQCLLDIISTIS